MRFIQFKNSAVEIYTLDQTVAERIFNNTNTGHLYLLIVVHDQKCVSVSSLTKVSVLSQLFIVAISGLNM